MSDNNERAEGGRIRPMPEDAVVAFISPGSFQVEDIGVFLRDFIAEFEGRMWSDTYEDILAKIDLFAGMQP